jgi:dipeptidyl aminopeptidase/acylaminoacyl peptidase
MYRALKRNGATVELVLFPREGHGFQELRHRLAKATKEFGWFENYIRGVDYTPEVVPDDSK